MNRRACEHGIPKTEFCMSCLDDFAAGFHIAPLGDGGIDMHESPNKDFYAVTDYAAAAADMLRSIVRQLDSGAHPEELGPQVVLIGRLMARRT